MITTKEIKENKIEIVPADNIWGYKVYQEVKGISKERSIFMLTTQRFKNGTFKAYPAVSVMINVDGIKMQRIILLHQLIWVFYYGDITDRSLVIDHIDNDPCNNDLENLQLLTRKDNITKEIDKLHEMGKKHANHLSREEDKVHNNLNDKYKDIQLCMRNKVGEF